jgi:hypothetical protein
MSNLIPIGVKWVKRGPIPDDGTMGDVLSLIGPTYKGSVSFVESAASEFNVMVEEHDDPIYQFFTKGAKKLAFSLPDWTPEVLVVVKGGEVVNDAWQAPDNVPIIEESYAILTQTDVLIEIPRLSVSAVLNGKLQKDAAGLLDVLGTPLKPEDAATKSVQISKYQAPVVNAGNAQNIAVDNANLVGTAAAYRGDISTISWTVDTKPVGAAPVFGTPNALNTTVNGLSVDGLYKFKMTVTDENGFSNSALVSVTVAL